MKTRSLPALLLTALLAWTALIGDVSAQDDPARAALEEGTGHVEAGRFADAQQAFERAFALGGDPSLLEKAADAAERAGDLASADRLWRRFVQEGSDDQKRQGQLRLQQLQARPSLVRVTSEPPGGAVWVDGKATGTHTPVELSLAPGHHTIEVRVEGHTPGSGEAKLGPGEQRALHLALAAAPPPALAALVVASTPSGTVLVDGVRVGTTPLRTELAPGRHRVEVRVEGHAPFLQEVAIEPGQTVQLQATLTSVRRHFRPSMRLGLAIPLGDGPGTGPETSLHSELVPAAEGVGLGFNLDWTWLQGGGLGTAVPAATFRVPLPQGWRWRARARAGLGLAVARLGEDNALDGQTGGFAGMAIALQTDVAVPITESVHVYGTPIGLDLIPAWFDFPSSITRLHFNAGVGGDLDW